MRRLADIRNTYRDTSACGGGTNVDCDRFYVFTRYDSECSFFNGPLSC